MMIMKMEKIGHCQIGGGISSLSIQGESGAECRNSKTILQKEQ
jgi:hypothetical protein